jgi:hypothetical protein
MINASIEIPDAKKIQLDEFLNGDVKVSIWIRTSPAKWKVETTFIIPQNRRELIAHNLWQLSSK